MHELTFTKISDQTTESPWSNELHSLNILLSSKYYTEYFTDGFIDKSFIISTHNELLGYCICYQIGDKICFPGEGADGARLHFLTDSWQNIPRIYNKIYEYLDLLIGECSCSEVVIRDDIRKGGLSDFSQILLNNSYSSRLVYDMKVDFSEYNLQKFYSNIRKSYKSLINWGKNNLEIVIVNKDNVDNDAFKTFKQFHANISGRQTRSDETWDIQYKMLKEGFGELILANYQGKLVAGSLFIDQFDVTIYFTGVYERQLFEFGISHYLLYLGISRSYDRGRTKAFSLGCYDTNIEDSKLHNIQFFKKGFCDRLIPTILWQKKCLAKVYS